MKKLRDKKTLESKIIRNVIFVIIPVVLALTYYLIISPKLASAAVIEPLYSVLQNTAGGAGATVANVWRSLINICNSLIIAVLIFIAIANILRINVNTYGIKKFLPTLFLAVIAANFSFLFCRLAVDSSNVVMHMLIHGSGSNASTAIGSKSDITKISGSFNFGEPDPEKAAGAILLTGGDEDGDNKTFSYVGLLKFTINTILQFAAAIIIFILAFLFFIRNYVIYFLVALAPLAFLSMILPQTKQAWNMWWSNFLRWTYLPIVSLFWLFVGGQFVDTLNDSAILSAIFGGVCYYLAITTPFKIGGGIMQSWGNLGKKVGGAVAFHPKRAAQRWWGNQADSDKWYNVVGHVARIKPMYDRKVADFDRNLKDTWEDKVQARLSRTRLGGRQDVREAKLGGEAEKAKNEAMRDYLRTEAGQRWVREGRAPWLDEKANTEKEVEKGYTEGQAAFRRSNEGRDLSQERLILDQQHRIAEDQINAVEKELLIQFMQNRGRFADEDPDNPEMRNLLANRIAFMSDNLMLDEGVKKSQQDNIDPYFSDQLHMQAVANSNPVRYRQLREKMNRGEPLDQDEAEKFRELQGVYENRNDPNYDPDRADREYNEIQDHLQMLVAERRKSPIGTDHLNDYLDLRNRRDPNADFAIRGMKAVASRVLGTQNPEAIKSFAKIMETRMGKLMSIEITGDVEKLTQKKTMREIADTLDEANAGRYYGDLKAQDENEARRSLINFKNGRGYLNRPEVNREIQVHNMALGKTARQNFNPEAPDAAAGMVNMLSDPAAINAGTLYNREVVRAARGRGEDPANYLIDQNATPQEIREFLEDTMLSRNQFANIAFVATANQEAVGQAKNAAEYLSGSFQDTAGDHHNQPIPVELKREQIVEMSKEIAEATKDSAGSFTQFSKTMGTGLGNVSGHLEAVQANLDHMRKFLAIDTATQLGAKISASDRKNFQRALAELPEGASTEDVAKVVSQFDKGGGFSGKVDTNTTVNLSQFTGGAASVKLAELPIKARNIEMLDQGLQIAAQGKNVEDHKPYIESFSNRPRTEVESNYKTLDSAYRNIQDTTMRSEERVRIAHDALRETNLAPAGEFSADTPAAQEQLWDRVALARNAAEASYGAFDRNGGFSIDKANDNLVSSKIQASEPSVE